MDITTCPQCGYQEKMEFECWRCGVIFAKLKTSQKDEFSGHNDTQAFEEETPQELSEEIEPLLRSHHSSSNSLFNWGWARPPKRSLPEAKALCAHLERALEFQFELTDALSTAPLSTRSRSYLNQVLSQPPKPLLTFVQRLERLELLPDQDCRLIEVATRYQNPLQGLREARLRLERSLERRRAFHWSIRTPRYLAIYALISETIYTIFIGTFWFNGVTIISLLTLALYPLLAFLKNHPRCVPWVNQIRFKLIPAESKILFNSTWARLIRSGLDPSHAAYEAFKIAQLPPKMSLALEELYPTINNHLIESQSHDQVFISKFSPQFPIVWERTCHLKLTQGPISQQISPQEFAQYLFYLSLLAEQEFRAWLKWGAILDRVIVSLMMMAYLAYQVITQFNQALEQIESLSGMRELNF